MPAVQTCGVDIDDESWCQSGHEVPETTENDENEEGTFFNRLGVEALMKCRGGGHRGKENMTVVMMTKSDVIHIRR
jgi:hypothetical protein